jgi:outer membrane protein OmpA-like peptidoglycan-associated protein
MSLKKLNALVLCLLLSACASVPSPQPPAELERKPVQEQAEADTASASIAEPVQRDKPSVAKALQAEAMSVGPMRYMDGQERHLRRLLQGTRVQVRRDSSSLIVIIPEDLAFGGQAFHNDQRVAEIMASVAEVLIAYRATHIRVEGHSDNTAKSAMSDSRQRAEAMAAYLQDQGIESTRIQILARGDKVPVASNHSEYGRSHNRRVELILTPKGF